MDTSVGQPAKTYIPQFCADTGYCQEDLQRVMASRDKWQEIIKKSALLACFDYNVLNNAFILLTILSLLQNQSFHENLDCASLFQVLPTNGTFSSLHFLSGLFLLCLLFLMFPINYVCHLFLFSLILPKIRV